MCDLLFIKYYLSSTQIQVYTIFETAISGYSKCWLFELIVLENVMSVGLHVTEMTAFFLFKE